MATHRSVTVVFDADFGSELERLAGRMPVWVVDTPANRTVAERLWQHPKLDITTFQARPGDTVEETCVSLLVQSNCITAHCPPIQRAPFRRSLVPQRQRISARPWRTLGSRSL